MEHEPASDAEEAESGPLNGAPLLLRAGGGPWSVPATTSWTNEAALRDLLARNPTVLPGVTDVGGAAVSEFGLQGVGRADVVAAESTAAITVCEAKLSTNAEMRRTIVGQVLAYASAFAGMSFDDFDASWSARSNGRSVLDDVLGEDATEEDRTSLRNGIAGNLRAGRVRIVIAVDSLTHELRRIVGYLAEHTDLDVVALELAYASRGEVEILVPRTWGAELSSVSSPSRPREPRSRGYRQSVAEVLPGLLATPGIAGTDAMRAITSVIEGLGDRIAYLYSGSPEMLAPVVVVQDPVPCQPIKIATTISKPGIRVCFHWCRKLPKAQLDAALRVLERHPAIAPLVAGVREADYLKGPLLPFAGTLEQPGAVETLTEALRTLVQA